VSDNIYPSKQQSKYTPLRRQGSASDNIVSEALSSGIPRGVTSSAASSSKGSRGRDPIPLTPVILLLLDRLEPDKGKQTRMLTEHLTGQRTLSYTEHELQTQLERKAEREIKRQQAATEAYVNRAATKQLEAHEAAMAAHLAHRAMANALTARATTEGAVAAG
jgi:hypothetical protein